MVYAVISDVHANFSALKSVFFDLKTRNIQKIYFLGDAVGYGPEPNECLELLKSECRVVLAGNHDWGVCGLTDIKNFNVYARQAIEWTRTNISIYHLELLRKLSLSFRDEDEGVSLVHATPCEPDRWHYLMDVSDAELNFGCFNTRFCFVGHSHRPLIIEKLPSGDLATERRKKHVGRDNRCIINCGSVGQPRDGDNRASYAVIDEDMVEIVRVSYDYSDTQKKMEQAGLPLPLIERLSVGL